MVAATESKRMSFEELQAHFQTHSRIRDTQAHSEKVHSVDWSCDGRKLASGSYDKTVCILSMDRDRLSKDFTCRGHQGTVDTLCWHQTYPELLATASGDKTVRVWDARSQKCQACVSTKGENINISWSPDGMTIAVGNKEDLVSFIDVRKFQIIRDEQFKFEVNEISWSNDNKQFFLTSGQGQIHILSYPSMEPIRVLDAHPAHCICIKFSPTGDLFAVGSADALVSIWDTQDLVCLRTLSRLDWPVRTISFSHDGRLLASASEDLYIDIADTESGAQVTHIPVEAPVFSVAWHPKRHLLAYACDDKDSARDGSSRSGNKDTGLIKVFGFPS